MQRNFTNSTNTTTSELNAGPSANSHQMANDSAALLKTGDIGNVMGRMLNILYHRVSDWMSSWFALSIPEQRVLHIKTQLKNRHLQQLYERLTYEARTLPDDGTLVARFSAHINEYVTSLHPFEQTIQSELMGHIYSYLRKHVDGEQARAALSPFTQNLVVATTSPAKQNIKMPEPIATEPEIDLPPIPALSPAMEVIIGKKFLHLFTNETVDIKPININVGVELGQLVGHYLAQDTVSADSKFRCALSYETSIFIGRAIANSTAIRRTIAQHGETARLAYGFPSPTILPIHFTDNDLYQISIRFLQRLHQYPLEKKYMICAAAFARTLQDFDQLLAKAKPGEPSGYYEIENGPVWLSDVELFAEMIRALEEPLLNGLITTISIFEGATYNAEELNYLCEYDSNLTSEPPASVQDLVIQHKYQEAVAHCPAADRQALAQHLSALVVSIDQRDQLLYLNTTASSAAPHQQRSSGSSAEQINNLRRRAGQGDNIFSATQNEKHPVPPPAVNNPRPRV